MQGLRAHSFVPISPTELEALSLAITGPEKLTTEHRNALVAFHDKARETMKDDAENDHYVHLAHEQYHKDGEIEVDRNATINACADNGAYVMAWVWVYDPDEEEDEHETETED